MDSQGSSPAPVAPVSTTVAPKPLHRKIEHVHKLEKWVLRCFFKKKCLEDVISFLFGHSYFCFTLLVRSDLGFKTRLYPSLVCFLTCYVAFMNLKRHPNFRKETSKFQQEDSGFVVAIVLVARRVSLLFFFFLPVANANPQNRFLP